MIQTSGTAAKRLGLSRRQVNRAAVTGRIVTDRIGGINVVSDRAIVAAARTASRGRRWSELSARAALELIEHGETRLVSGSARSRLKARLRSATAADLGYQLLTERVSLWRETGASPSAFGEALSRELGLAVDGGLVVVVAAEAPRRARELRLVEDIEGDVLLVESDSASRLALGAVGLYAFGGPRESSTAEAWLMRQIATL